MTKLDPDHLPGTTKERVFVGGHYDFVPVLRAIARFISNLSSPDGDFRPIIPLDYAIPEEETMDTDLRIVDNCGFAIFDLSDLGAQLVEMQEARQKKIKTLLVYPVRERKNEPERGRRTVLSFGLPHFGYSAFEELEGIVWRFLMDVPVERDFSPRLIRDSILDREIKRSRMHLGRGDIREAKRVIEAVFGQRNYGEALEPWLLRGLIARRESDDPAIQNALDKATQLVKTLGDEGELWYYRAILEMEKKPTDWAKVRDNLVKACEKLPEDGRVLTFLGYACWHLQDHKEAIARTREALGDRYLPDPMVAIHAINNLAYYLCEECMEGRDSAANMAEALDLTKYLPAYQKAFQARRAGWLDTRGWVLTCSAKLAIQAGSAGSDVKQTVEAAIRILSEAEKADPGHELVRKHLEEARRLQAGIKT
jgi:hypothetical protein